MPLTMSTASLARFFGVPPYSSSRLFHHGDMKFMRDVGAAHVEVHAVEAGLLRPLGGVDVLAGDVLDLGDGERPDHVPMEVG